MLFALMMWSGCVDCDRREGCMTDKVIANIKDKYDSIDDLDGLDELKYLSHSNTAL